jgi:hypothetical protein
MPVEGVFAASLTGLSTRTCAVHDPDQKGSGI